MKNLFRRSVAILLILVFSIPNMQVFAYWNGQFYKETNDVYYMAGVMNYSIWKYNDGTWQDGISPQSTNVSMDASYKFTVADRKITKVTMERYNSDNSTHIKTWNATRTEDANNLAKNACYVKSVATNPSWSGVGTDTADVQTNLKLDLTKNYNESGKPNPKDERKDWQGTNVEGFTYDVPVVFRIELEPEQIELPTVTVQHFNRGTGTRLEQDNIYSTPVNSTVTESSKNYPGLVYANSVISEDGGMTWKLLSTNSTRNITVKKDTIIRFYYADEGSVIADLNLTANPHAIEKGKTSKVSFTLDASGSSSSTGIKKYEFWFSDDKDKLTGTPHYTTTQNSWTTSKSGVAPNTKWYGRVRVTSGTDKTDTDDADITIGELEKNIPIEVMSRISISSDDPKVIDKWEEGGWVKVEVPYNVIENNEPYELEVKLDGSKSRSTNGIGQYEFRIRFPYEETIVSNTPVVYKKMTLYPQNNVWVQLVVNDAIDNSKTDMSDDMMDITLEAKKIPPNVELGINKREFFYGETAIFTPTFDEHENKTFKIHNKDWSISDSKGKTVKEGKGVIPGTVVLDWDGGDYRAEQTIYYFDQDNIEHEVTAEVTFKVKAPRPEVDLKVLMINRFNNEQINIAHNNKGKIYKEIKLDISNSINITDSEVQKLFPIQFGHERTQMIVLPITSSGEFDVTRKEQIYTYSNADRVFENERLTFKGKQSMTIRIDVPGNYKAMAKVYNGMLDSEWAVVNFEVRPDPPPVITKMELESAAFDDSKGLYVDYRDTEDLKTRFKLIADYTVAKDDDDTVDTDNIKLNLKYDDNNNGLFDDDGTYSSMYITKSTNVLANILSVTKDGAMKNLDFTSINTRNILGTIYFDYYITKKPTISYYEGGDMPVVPKHKVNRNVRLLIDNRPGNIKVEMGKESKVEITIIMGTDTLYFDLNTLKEHYGDNAKIYIIDKNGNKELVN